MLGYHFILTCGFDRNTMDMQQIAHPEYVLFKDRLATYSLWPPQLTQTDYKLAQAGLFYSNVSDRVTCFACGILLWGWKEDDDPLLEHYKHRKDCFYMKMVGGVRLEAEQKLPATSTKPYEMWKNATPWTKNKKDEPDK